MRLSSTILLFASLGIALPAAASAGGWTVHPHEWYSEFSGSRVYSSAFFLDDRRDAPLPDGGRFQQFTVDSYNEIGWKKNVSLVLDVPFLTQTLRAGTETATIAGLGDLTLGARVRLRDDGPGLILDAGWVAPLGYDHNVFPRLGDGRQKAYTDLAGGLSLPYVRGFIEASRGFLFIGQDGNLYSQTSADGGVWVSKSVLVGGSYFDNRAWNSSAANQSLGDFYRAGPLLLVRVDDHMDVSVGAVRNVSGRNALEGTQIYMAIGMKQTKLNPLQGFLGTKRH